MDYSNVRELQQTVRKSATSYGFGLLGPVMEVSIGVGTTPVRNQYKLAVRLHGIGPLYWRFRTALRTLVGDAELDLLTTPPVRILGGCPAGPPVTRPLAIGASIGFHAGGGGTVGFFARRRSDEKLGVVSNNHVIALQDRGVHGDAIFHPSRCDGGTQGVAMLDDSYPDLAGGGMKLVDAAFAELDPGVVVADMASLGIDGRLDPTPALPQDGDEVVKIGRTTGRREGRIRAFDFDRLVVKSYRLGIGKVRFRDQIEIEATTNQQFSNSGDSGSLVYNRDRRPVGLLFAETSIGGAGNLGLQYANPIGAVLSQLGVDVAIA